MVFNVTSEDRTAVSVGLNDLTLSDLQKILFEEQEVILSAQALNEVNDSYLFLEDFLVAFLATFSILSGVFADDSSLVFLVLDCNVVIFINDLLISLLIYTGS